MATGAQQLRDWMDRRGYNQVETAAELGLTEAMVSLIVNGKRKPGREMAVKIEEVAGIPVKAWSSSPHRKSRAAVTTSRDNAPVISQ